MLKAIQYSNKYIGDVDKEMRKAITQFSNKNWQKSIALFHTHNKSDQANLMASFGLLYASAQLNKEKEAVNYANLVLHYTNFEFWAYLEEHNFPRYARRFALHYLAYYYNNQQKYSEAINYIDDALNISSVIDELDNIPLLETKVTILLAWKKQFKAFGYIQLIVRNQPENTKFIELTKSKTYQTYLAEFNSEDTLIGSKDETAMQALNRLIKYSETFETNTDNYLPSFGKKVSEEEILETEKRLDFKFPPSYKHFIIKNGLFKLGTNNEFESCLLEPKEMVTLFDALKLEWKETFNQLNEEELQATKQLICFSYGDESLQKVWYYCFDKRSFIPETGEMHVYEYSQENWSFKENDTSVNYLGASPRGIKRKITFNFDASVGAFNLDYRVNNNFNKHISKIVDTILTDLSTY